VRIWKLLPRPNICEAATSPICHHVICHFGTARTPIEKNRKQKSWSVNSENNCTFEGLKTQFIMSLFQNTVIKKQIIAKEINEMIYTLYGLSEEEVEIIEK